MTSSIATPRMPSSSGRFPPGRCSIRRVYIKVTPDAKPGYEVRRALEITDYQVTEVTNEMANNHRGSHRLAVFYCPCKVPLLHSLPGTFRHRRHMTTSGGFSTASEKQEPRYMEGNQQRWGFR